MMVAVFYQKASVMNSRLFSSLTAGALALMLAIGSLVQASDDLPPSDNTPEARQAFSADLQKAEAGDARAQFDVARAYQTGKGVPPNYARAGHWLTKAAEQGLEKAEVALGNAYDLGMGVPLDSEAAVHWWQKAAKHGNVSALKSLAYAYFEGQGVEKSYLNSYVVWQQLPLDDEEAQDAIQSLRRWMPAEMLEKADGMTLDDVFNGR